MFAKLGRKRTLDNASLDFLETQAGLVHRAPWVDERCGELLDRSVILRQRHVKVLVLADDPVCDEGSPHGIERIEHIDAAGVTEIATVLIAAKVDQHQTATTRQLGCTVQQYPLPVLTALFHEGGEFRTLRPHHVHMV